MCVCVSGMQSITTVLFGCQRKSDTTWKKSTKKVQFAETTSSTNKGGQCLEMMQQAIAASIIPIMAPTGPSNTNPKKVRQIKMPKKSAFL